jgi:hypothetical protein
LSRQGKGGGDTGEGKCLVLAVVGHVHQSVVAQELGGEEVVVLVPRDHDQLLGLRLDLHLQRLGHVRRGLHRVLGHQRCVPRRLGHLHPPVVRQHRWHRAEHEDDAPLVVGLRHGGRHGVDLVRRRRERRAERGGEGERDDAAGEDAEALHREDGGDEHAAGLLVGVLRHDGGAQRVVVADAEAEPEAEEAERGHDAVGRVPEREAQRDGAYHHEQQRHAVHALPAELVAEPAEEELPLEGVPHSATPFTAAATLGGSDPGLGLVGSVY